MTKAMRQERWAMFERRPSLERPDAIDAGSVAARTYRDVRVVGNRAVMTARRQLRSSDVDAVPESALDAVFEQYDEHPTVFVHVGLSDVKSAFKCDPYEFLRDRLDTHFENVLVQGFTPSFRSPDGRVYHKDYSVPKYGTFSTLFLDDCDYRTDDATNSILVRGDYRFDDCDHHDTWSSDGCFGALDRDNVLVLDIGTNWIRAAQIHYLEVLLDVPYVTTTDYEGVIYYDDSTHEPVTQRSHEYERPITWNRAKIKDDLQQDGVLEHHELNGLDLFAFEARELRHALAPRIEDDPHYLVT